MTLKRGMQPEHPGKILREIYLSPLEITITDAAKKLGITRKTLSQLVNGHMGISAEMALRLSIALNTTPELWLNMQQSYDLWFASQKMKSVEIGQIA
ncbi:HigA family addiction module antitoxin [Membranihabitans maritimus]|uniref:HigA family addiction module antitoxin n=1 Tax=Membranihabitans maritimus TaxID=2904244 RepID=UPI001F014BA8|nr:HigA family addiction module antitoxin [Membranihabitans maritimus]